jgi:hypothetical protein
MRRAEIPTISAIGTEQGGTTSGMPVEIRSAKIKRLGVIMSWLIRIVGLLLHVHKMSNYIIMIPHYLSKYLIVLEICKTARYNQIILEILSLDKICEDRSNAQLVMAKNIFWTEMTRYKRW